MPPVKAGMLAPENLEGLVPGSRFFIGLTHSSLGNGHIPVAVYKQKGNAQVADFFLKVRFAVAAYESASCPPVKKKFDHIKTGPVKTLENSFGKDLALHAPRVPDLQGMCEPVKTT